MALAYRKPITITNTGGALNNYSELVVVDTAALIGTAKLEADGDDLRFTTATGAPCDHWVCPGTINETTTAVYVRVPTIAASPATTKIYMYYGDPALTNVESLTNAIPAGCRFFEDNFDSGVAGDALDSIKWPYTRGVWKYVDDTANGGVGNSANYVSGSTTLLRIIGNVDSIADVDVIARMRDSAAGKFGGICLRTTNDIATDFGVGYLAGFNGIAVDMAEIYRNDGGSQAKIATVNHAEPTTYRVVRFQAYGTTLRFYYDGVNYIEIPDATYANGRIGLASYENYFTPLFDWIIAREIKTAVTNSVGAEEPAGPLINTVTPDRGYQGSTVPIVIAGANFAATPAVKLTKGAETINCTGEVLTGTTSIACNVPIGVAETLGWWDMTVTNP